MIKMLTDTCYNGKNYKNGKEYGIDKPTEIRWIKNGIAEEIVSKQKYTPKQKEEETDQPVFSAAKKIKGGD